MLNNKKVGFIGAGKMGEAMIRGMIEAGLPGKSISILELDKKRRDFIRLTYKVSVAKSLQEMAADADALVIAVKPGSVDSVLGSIDWSAVKKSLLIISIAAGVPLKRFLAAIGPDARAVRVMPNTPALIRSGISGYCLSKGCKDKDRKLTGDILQAMGPALELTDEGLLDAVTGLSGSGPAYVYVMIEALADAGVMMGLTREQALSLASHTVAGAAGMVIQTGSHPAQLKDQVTSPGGTTAAGLFELEKNGFRKALQKAVKAATLRSQELGKGKKE